MKPTINTKKIKIDGKSYTLRALTIKQIRPIIASDYTDDISIAAYLAAEGTEEIADMEFVENQPVGEFSHYTKLAHEVMDFNGLGNKGDTGKK